MVPPVTSFQLPGSSVRQGFHAHWPPQDYLTHQPLRAAPTPSPKPTHTEAMPQVLSPGHPEMPEGSTDPEGVTRREDREGPHELRGAGQATQVGRTSDQRLFPGLVGWAAPRPPLQTPAPHPGDRLQRTLMLRQHL